MARMPGADWRPIDANHSDGGMGTIFGVTLHIMAGTLEGTQAWFNNPQADASSHFGTGKQGALRQWVDTSDKAWAQAKGNPNWISIENEGKGGDALTDAQLDDCARVLAWAHRTHGVPLQVTTSPTGRGLGHHAMGGAAWGGHSACPGAQIIAQKPEIVKRARAIVAGKPAPAAAPAKLVWKNGVPAFPGRVLQLAEPMMHGQDVKAWQDKLAKRGWDIGVDGWYGAESAAVCKVWQRETGRPVTGKVDKHTWDDTWSWRPAPGLVDESN